MFNQIYIRHDAKQGIGVYIGEGSVWEQTVEPFVYLTFRVPVFILCVLETWGLIHIR